MSRNWKKNEISYLKRYAVSKRLDELARRFGTDAAEVRAKLAELGLSAKDGPAAAETGPDPQVVAFEQGLAALYGKKWSKARGIFAGVVAESDLHDLVARARQFLAVCEARLAATKAEEDPFLLAVFHKNRGDYAAARKALGDGGGEGEERALYLVASIHALEERLEEAAETLARAIELNPENRVHAFHDSDFAELRRRSEYAYLFGLG